MKEDILKIINHYGFRNQLKKLNEECYELIEAVIDYMDDGARCTLKEHIAEEIADCMVLLEQFRLYYDIPTEKIRKVMEYKVKRQIERIENESN